MLRLLSNTWPLNDDLGIKEMVLFLRLIVSSFLIVLAALKITNDSSNVTIYNQWIGHSDVLNYIFIFFEVTVGLWMATGYKVEWSSKAVVFILSFFTVLIIIELNKEYPRVCGCGGRKILERLEDIKSSLRWSLFRNLFLISAASIIILFSDFKREKSASS